MTYPWHEQVDPDGDEAEDIRLTILELKEKLFETLKAYSRDLKPVDDEREYLNQMVDEIFYDQIRWAKGILESRHALDDKFDPVAEMEASAAGMTKIAGELDKMMNGARDYE